jgi:hypothetical protein
MDTRDEDLRRNELTRDPFQWLTLVLGLLKLCALLRGLHKLLLRFPSCTCHMSRIKQATV